MYSHRYPVRTILLPPQLARGGIRLAGYREVSLRFDPRLRVLNDRRWAKGSDSRDSFPTTAIEQIILRFSSLSLTERVWRGIPDIHTSSYRHCLGTLGPWRLMSSFFLSIGFFKPQTTVVKTCLASDSSGIPRESPLTTWSYIWDLVELGRLSRSLDDGNPAVYCKYYEKKKTRIRT